MKVARLHSIGDMRLHDEPAPQPGPGEIVVRVKAVGLCGSDLHWFGEGGIGDAQLARPLVLGHEFAGITATGQRVAIDPAIPCGICRQCREGNPNLCTDLRFAGHGGQDGGLQELISWPKHCLFSIPDAISFEEAAMLEPLGVAIHAVDLGKVRTGMRVGVFGCGPIGLLVIQTALAAGATQVSITEPLGHRREAAAQLGAVIWKPGEEVDVAFECAGENEAVEDAIAAVRPGARVVLVGIPPSDRTTFSASVARRKGLSLLLARRMKNTYPRAIRLVESGRVDVRSLITQRFALQEIAAAFAAAHKRKGLKIMVEIGEGLA